jgi:hypothetical protein
MRVVLPMTQSQYFDWMHTYVASGGLAQYELNGIVLHVVNKYEIPLSDIDAWCENVKLPKGMSKLPKKFFQNRVVERADARMKAFASEMLTAVMLFGFFVDVLVKSRADAETMQYVDCFDLLRAILAILQRGDIRDLPTARMAVQCHHRHYNSLGYHKIPKLHIPVHILDFWEYWSRLLSCFGPERHHKLMKRVMSFSYNKGATTTLAHDVRTWIRNLDLPHLYRAVHFTGTVRNISINVVGGLVLVSWAGALNTPMGLLAKHDLIQYKTDDGDRVGLVVGFACDNAGLNYVAVVTPLMLEPSGGWRRLNGILSIVPVPAIIGGVPFFEIDQSIYALLHASS